jgi:hypothetical protein
MPRSLHRSTPVGSRRRAQREFAEWRKPSSRFALRGRRFRGRLLAGGRGWWRHAVGADTGDDEVEVLAVSTQNPGYVLGASASWVRGDLYVIAGLGKGKVTPAPTSFGAPATSDGLDAPADVSVDGTGNVLLADARNGKQPPWSPLRGLFRQGLRDDDRPPQGHPLIYGQPSAGLDWPRSAEGWTPGQASCSLRVLCYRARTRCRPAFFAPPSRSRANGGAGPLTHDRATTR